MYKQTGKGYPVINVLIRTTRKIRGWIHIFSPHMDLTEIKSIGEGSRGHVGQIRCFETNLSFPVEFETLMKTGPFVFSFELFKGRMFITMLNT